MKWLRANHDLTDSQAYLVTEVAYTHGARLPWSDTFAKPITFKVCGRKGWLALEPPGIAVCLTDKAKEIIAAREPNLTQWTMEWVKTHDLPSDS